MVSDAVYKSERLCVSLPTKEEGKLCDFGQSCNITKLQLNKMGKKSVGFSGPLTSPRLVRSLNHRKRAEPRAQRSCASRSKKITTRLVITWFSFSWICSSRTKEELPEMGYMVKWEKDVPMFWNL